MEHQYFNGSQLIMRKRIVITPGMRQQMFEYAIGQCLADGAIDWKSLAEMFSVSRARLQSILRSRASELPRRCQHVLANRLRCDKPVCEEGLGRWSVETCSAHTSIRTSSPLPDVSPSLAGAGAGPMIESELRVARAAPVQLPLPPAVVEAPDAGAIEPSAVEVSEVDHRSPSVDIVRVDIVNGWPLAVVLAGGKEVSRLGHLEISRRFEYADAKDLVALALGIWPDLKLRVPSAEFRDGSRGPMKREYFFTRDQVLKLAAKSNKPVAETILDDMIAVFGAWQDGKLAPRQSDAAALIGAIMPAVGAAIAKGLTQGFADVRAEFRAELDGLRRPASDRQVVVDIDPTAVGLMTIIGITKEADFPTQSAAQSNASKAVVVEALKVSGMYQNPEHSRSTGRKVVGPEGVQPARHDHGYFREHVESILMHGLREIAHKMRINLGVAFDGKKLEQVKAVAIAMARLRFAPTAAE